MADPAIERLILAERDRVARLLPTLGDGDWATPSLCDGWTVRHVVGHLVVAMTGDVRRVGRALVVARGSFDRAMDAEARKEADHDIDELVDRFRGASSTINPPPFLGIRSPLADVLIHAQDIAIPLATEIDSDPESLRLALDFLANPRAARLFGGAPHRNARLIASDLDWSSSVGSGDTIIEGPARALLLRLGGRTALDDQLTLTTRHA